MLERFNVEGVVPVTRGDIHACINEAFAESGGHFENLCKRVDIVVRSVESRQNELPRSTSESVTCVSNSASVYAWGERFHMVPEGFIFPSYSVGTMWNLWHFGDDAHGVGAYKNIQPSHDLRNGNSRVKFSKCKAVMNRLLDLAMDSGVMCTRKVTKDTEQDVFNHAYVALLRLLYKHYPSRPASININTIANRLAILKNTTH